LQRYFIQLSYDGTAYHGWQVQINTTETVQHALNTTFSKVLNEPIQMLGCGRTDAGVHASDFYAHFESEKTDLLFDEHRWLFKLNHALPKDIALHKIIPVHPSANARFDAVARTYQYIICRKKNPFHVNKACYLYGPLDVGLMNEAAKILFEYIDFSAFAKSNTQNSSNNCKLYKAEWKEEGDFVIFTISANRFLRNMVRAIVGTFLEIGKGKRSINDLRGIIESKDRSKSGASAHACGLYLTKVDYRDGILEGKIKV
jgi:tRNA pseudouridine38-40 synthase